MPTASKTVKPINIYLAKESVTDPESLLVDNKPESVPVTIGDRTLGTLYFRQTPAHTPKWLNLFEAQREAIGDLQNTSTGAVLLMQAGDRYFALTFGVARSLIRFDEMFEERFGLITALNSISPTKMRRMDTLSLEMSGRISRIQVGKTGRFEEFGLDVDRDLMFAVTGSPTDSTMGKVMSGRDVLSLRVPADIEDLERIVMHCYQAYKSETYKVHYDWIDSVKEVRDKTVINGLSSKVLERFKCRTFDGMWMAIPEPLDWENVAGFSFTSSDSDEPQPELSLEGYADSFRELEAVSLDSFRKRKVRVIPADETSFPRRWTAFNCLYSEEDLNGQKYVLSNGRWFSLDLDFVNKISEEIRRLNHTIALELPPYTGGGEGEYNKSTAANSNSQYFLMDCRTVQHGGGRSKIEFCDLYSDQKALICVKKSGSSSVLSHLFQQGVVSANLWLADAGFRKKVNRLLPKSLKQNYQQRPDPAEHPIVYAIITKNNRPILEALPFFSKLSLRNAAKSLNNLGFKISVIKIRDEG